MLKAKPAPTSLKPEIRQGSRAATNAKKIFIVHGHDDGLKNTVARFLTALGLRPIILHEQPSRGQTIIEKFEHHSDVGFAVVLLTPDDKGGLASQSSAEYVLRARQNVVMELGYFLGRLGRRYVAAIYDERVEMPSDYRGVAFIPYDPAGNWKHSLLQEIKAAGIPVDANRIYRQFNRQR